MKPRGKFADFYAMTLFFLFCFFVSFLENARNLAKILRTFA